jgi:hypothetical protein
MPEAPLEEGDDGGVAISSNEDTEPVISTPSAEIIDLQS